MCVESMPTTTPALDATAAASAPLAETAPVVIPDQSSGQPSPSDTMVAATGDAPQGNPQKPDAKETQEQITERINTAMGQARKLVEAAYDTTPAIVANQLGKKERDPQVQAEIARRRQALDANPQLKQALVIQKRTNDIYVHAKKAYQDAVTRAKKLKKSLPDEKTFLGQYYDAENGLYYVLDAYGQQKETYDKTQSTVPVIAAVRVLATETAGTPPVLTVQAQQAKELLEKIEPDARLIVNENGQAYFDCTPDLSEMKAYQETIRGQHEIEVAEKVLLAIAGLDVKDHKKAQEHPNPRIGRITNLIYLYNHADTTDPMRRHISASLHVELRAFQTNPRIGEEVAALGQYDSVYAEEFRELRTLLRGVVIDVTGQPVDAARLDQVPEEQLFGWLCIASASEGALIEEYGKSPRLPGAIQDSIATLVNTGQADTFAPQLVTILARSNRASGILKDRYGLTQEKMKESRGKAATIAQAVSSDMNERGIIQEMKDEGVIPEDTTPSDVANFLVGHTNGILAKIEGAKKIPTWLLIGAGLFAMFAQPIGELAKAGVPEEESKR